MILAEKIIALRKKMNCSQEELAEKLDVSRQSVSKWEVGATIPDLDKILKMSEIFGVSTDYLLKDEMGEAEPSGGKDVPEKRMVSVEEANACMDLAGEVSGRIALAISLFIVSPVCLLQLLVFAGTKAEMEKAPLIGVAVLLVFVAVGAAICVYHGIRLEKFEYLEKETFSLQYGVEGIVMKRKNDFEGTFRLFTTIGVVLCIVGVIPLMIAAALEGEYEKAPLMGVNVLLLFVSIGVHLLVRAGIVQASFQKLLQCGDYTAENKMLNQKLAYFPPTYWLIMTAIYLGYSFYTNRWGSSWIIWPVVGVLFAAIEIILKAVAKKRYNIVS